MALPLVLMVQSVKHRFEKFVINLFTPCDPTPLALFRILFGFLMFLDVPQERSLEEVDYRFGDPNYCFFPLIPAIEPLKLSHACIMYSFMWLGSVGIMLGFRFKLSCATYFVPYLYLFLLDKSRWNNHSYFFGLLVILMTFSGAAKRLSLDSWVSGKNSMIPRWNYYMIKFQLFILYFYAAVKKIDADWLAGYSMRNLCEHWIFSPMKLFVSEQTLEFYMIHLGGFIYDLTVGFMLNLQMTKKLAFFLSFIFHGLNSQIFTIGMFPYVCLASLVLFCEPHEFPCNLFPAIKASSNQGVESIEAEKVSATSAGAKKKYKKSVASNQSSNPDSKFAWSWNKVTTLTMMSIYVMIQLFLPFSHFITQGYNNWTPGLYGYSWDMMVHSWKTLHIKVTVVDHSTGVKRYLDPDVWVTNDRWSSHADMAKQYSECIARNLHNNGVTNNISVHLDVWKSLNGRFQQRIFDPRVDIIKAPWSPWEPVPWVLPLLREYSHWRRERLDVIAKSVSNWTASSNVVFVADFPGLFLENYLPIELSNVTLTLMKGHVLVEQELHGKKYNTSLNHLSPDLPSVQIMPEGFHRIYTTSETPSLYMYTYSNATTDSFSPQSIEAENDEDEGIQNVLHNFVDYMSYFVTEKIEIFSRSFYLVFNAYLNVLFDVPMVVRHSSRRYDD